ncbi:c-type cytochrome [Campylobacter hyointestinalis]|uniref:Cytochrome c domain-containing protein n=1 Tax=Campylobacter hyointestinalis subsp. lawsonii TaxID=91353 RepID=A0AAV6EF22_CAMHY|nr:hypothetical protein [Campylobacter hyointestinalis]KAB0612475.1 hypothetical protein F7P66_06545 [Campylobacter hyointestinalis subsp. lawsonii]QKF68926.1 monoheme c-type cytochrome [Campylobacter hyointestinalis subsp. lawsonii]RAZ29501.1 hypothetical protein CHLT_01390 [Campylobacter hyointestinalis subsp. lawsonii]
MKKLAIFTICVLFFIGCSDEKNRPETKSVDQNQTSITIKKGDENASGINKWISYDMDGAKNIKFGIGDDSNETTKSIGALAMRRMPLQSINKALIRGQLSKNFITKCSACHDDYANGIIGPSLLTKSSEEIFDMIKAYKTKTKVNVLMADLVKPMSDKEINGLANEISEFNAQFRSKK